MFIFLLAYFALVIAIIVGYIMNVIDLIHSDFNPLTGFVVARIIGLVVVPLGAVLGYF